MQQGLSFKVTSCANPTLKFRFNAKKRAKPATLLTHSVDTIQITDQITKQLVSGLGLM